MAKEIVVIGGGAAGLMAAITAARQGAAVTLFGELILKLVNEGKIDLLNNIQ